MKTTDREREMKTMTTAEIKTATDNASWSVLAMHRRDLGKGEYNHELWIWNTDAAGDADQIIALTDEQADEARDMVDEIN
jgi:hypothetical protein